MIAAAYTRLDPAVYPHLNIYPTIAGACKPVHPTPVPSALDSIKAADVYPSLNYPFLVICKSQTLARPFRYLLGTDPSAYPWIDVYPSAAGGVTRPPSQVYIRQARTRLASHPRTKLRKRFTADEDAPPVPKLPEYVTVQGVSQMPSPQHGRMLSFRGTFAYPVMSICD